jgi:hypothetical protein
MLLKTLATVLSILTFALAFAFAGSMGVLYVLEHMPQ